MDITATRTNRNGHQCPPWCVTGHDEEFGPGIFADVHATGQTGIGTGEYGSVRVGGCLMPSTGLRRVHVSLPPWPPLFLSAVAAETVACLAEQLATATPEQHRELAAAIRQAAAVITGEAPGARQ